MRDLTFLEPMLREAVAQGVFPSAVAAVGQKDRVLARCAVGDADLATRFDMASMSKILGPTMIALRGIEDGDLTLDDTVGRVFPDAPSDKAGITVRMLMTHTGGFEPFFWLFEETDDPGDAAGCILRHPLAGQPDGTPRYSCMGYILLGKMLEKIYGAPLGALAKARVFDPLGMTDTAYCPTGDNFAPTEVDALTGVAWRGVVHDENARFLGGVSGNAGVFSTVGDVIRYAATLACGGLDYLTQATVRKAIRCYTPGHDTRRGLGFHLGGVPGSFMGDLFPDDSFGHTGFTGTSLVIDPATGLFAILLTNRVHPTRANEKLLRFRRVFHNRIFAALSGGAPDA